MRVDIKPGVRLKEINDHLVTVCRIVAEVEASYNVIPTITSGCDGAHMPGSYHFDGEAWDFRTRDLLDPWTVASMVRDRLKGISKAYDVVYGDKDHIDHIHIEWDKKKGT